jgi:Flp pilus assembly protein CpaB
MMSSTFRLVFGATALARLGCILALATTAVGTTAVGASGCACPEPRCPRARQADRSPTSYLMKLDEPERTQERIVVARVALEAGTALRTSVLEVRDQPPDFQWAGHLRPVDLVHFAGRRLRKPVKAGAPIRRADLVGAEGAESGDGQGAARLLPRGSRSVTLQVDWVGGSGTWVKPGDHVDVGLVRRGGGRSRPALVMLMQNARVLMAAPYSEGSKAKRGRLWISILALPREAHGLALAQRLGRIVLFPRNPGDSRPVVYPPVTIKDLESSAFWKRLQRKRQRTIQPDRASDDPAIRIK